MLNLEPLEALLPGTWTLAFVDAEGDKTGEGEYTFKIAGVFDADVRDIYSGRATWRGYWQVEDARLILDAQEMTAWCSSCMGGGVSHEWTIELERVTDDAFSGILRAGDTKRKVVFKRV